MAYNCGTKNIDGDHGSNKKQKMKTTYTAKCKFRFQFNDKSKNGTMESFHEGTGETEESAMGNAWDKMAADNFKRNLIINTKSIELIECTIQTSAVR